MPAEEWISRILDDESLTRDLEEAEASQLVQWAVKRAESVIAAGGSAADLSAKVEAIRRRGRAVAKVLAAWQEGSRDKAVQLAVAASLPVPDNDSRTTAEVLMQLLGARD